jgi:hypothetical protein
MPWTFRFRLTAFVLILSALTIVLYARTLRQPFVQDDWTVLHEIRTSSVSDYLLHALSPSDKILYRPLAKVGFLLTFHLFDFQPLGFHILALVMHIVNSVLVSLVVERVTGRRGIAAAVGVLYAAGTTIHADTLLWIVGMYDLWAVLFFLTSLLLYFDRKPMLSAAAFLLSVLTKEAVAPLGLVFLFHALLLDRSKLRLLRWHGVVIVAYAFLHLFGANILDIGGSHPYRVELTGMHLVANAGHFVRWALQTLFPLWSPSPRLGAVILVLALALLGFVLVFRGRDGDRSRLSEAAFFVLWAIAGVLPAMLLTHHLFRYYAVYSLAPVLVLAVMYGETILPVRLHRYAGILLFVFLAANVAGNWISFNHRFDAEPSSVAEFDGTNHLIRKGVAVHTARSQLLLRYPSLPPGTRLVISGTDLEAFGKHYGPRLWYADSTLSVFSPAEYDSMNALMGEREKGALFLRFDGDSITHLP